MVVFGFVWCFVRGLRLLAGKSFNGLVDICWTLGLASDSGCDRAGLCGGV